jgi:hypothetical protein
MGLLDGPLPAAGAENLASHEARLGRLPSGSEAQGLIPVLEASGLQGRGGAGFPVGRKWRSVAERSGGHAVVLANGAESEPLSMKDRTLMAARPHLVLDGALLAAEVVGAERIALYVGRAHAAAAASLRRAIAERGGEVVRRTQVVVAPSWYPLLAPGPVPEHLREHARQAVAACPVVALRLERVAAAPQSSRRT